MGVQKLTDRTLFGGTLATGDLLHIVDVSDTSQSPAGSSYKLQIGQLRTFFSDGDEGYLPVFNASGALVNSRVNQDANDVIVTGTTDFTGLTLYKSGKEGGFTVNTAYPWIYLQKAGQNNFQLLAADTRTYAVVRGSLEWRDITTNNVYELVNTLTGFRSLQAPTGSGATPGALLHVVGSGTTSASYGLKVTNSSAVSNFAVRDDGIIEAGQGGGGGNSSLKIGHTIGGYGSGTGNVGIGYAALLGLTSGHSNTVVGSAAGGAITSGAQNTLVGTSAMYQSSTGNYNTAAGYSALQAYTGNHNTAFGHRALYSATSGDGCTSVGSASLYNNSTGARNTAIGTNAGFTVNAAGGVYLGYGAGYYETGANKLFIDNALRSNEADGRAKALIYGVFDSSVANQLLRLNASVGVNIAPSAGTQLSVLGAGSTNSTNALIVGSGNYAEILKIDDSGEARFNDGNSQKDFYFGDNARIASSVSGGQGLLIQFDLYNCGLATTLDANDQIIQKVKNLGVNTYQFGTGAVGVISQALGTAPSTNVGDAYQLYAADVVAGNTAPHFKTETGDVIKLYKYVSADFGNTVNTGDPDTNDLINALISALTAQGLIST